MRALEAGETLPPLSAREECRRTPAATTDVPALDRRKADQRRALRHRGIVERASVTWRGKKTLVGIVNISRGGATIETRLLPPVGQTLILEVPDAAPAEAVVRWVRRGLVGLDFGEADFILPGVY